MWFLVSDVRDGQFSSFHLNFWFFLPFSVFHCWKWCSFRYVNSKIVECVAHKNFYEKCLHSKRSFSFKSVCEIYVYCFPSGTLGNWLLSFSNVFATSFTFLLQLRLAGGVLRCGEPSMPLMLGIICRNTLGILLTIYQGLSHSFSSFCK